MSARFSQNQGNTGGHRPPLQFSKGLSVKTKVFHVITKLELGGAQKVTLMTLERLPRDQYELGLIAGPEGILVNWANQIPDLTRFWIPNLVREVRHIQDSITLLKLWNLFRRERPHIVH